MVFNNHVHFQFTGCSVLYLPYSKHQYTLLPQDRVYWLLNIDRKLSRLHYMFRCLATIGLQIGQKTMLTCRSLISIRALHHSPVRSISQYTLGKVPCQEHNTIYYGQGPLSGTYQNILWPGQAAGCHHRPYVANDRVESDQM